MSLVPSFIETLSPYVPGKPIEETEREYGITGAVKLASNENPLGPSPRALEAIARVLPKLHLYPDGASFYLKRRMAAKFGVAEGQIALGNGSNELLELLIRTFVHGDDEILTSEQTFAVYGIAAQAVGRKFVTVPMKDHAFDLEAMAKAVTPKTRMIFIANPDNPGGSYQGRAALLRFLDAIGERPLVVMDEAYFEYVTAPDYPNSLELQQKYPNVITARTFSKIYGLAGVRLGYVFARPEIIGYLERTRAPFNVSLVAQVAGLAALDDEAHVKRSRELNRQGLEELYRELPKFGLTPLPSQGNFVLVDFHRPTGPVNEALLRQGIIVRPVRNYGYPTCLRITSGTPEDHRKLFAALAKVL
jgi:histidinol-phosphate aminotransferase